MPEIWSDLVKSTKEKDFDRVMKLSALTHELMPLYDMDSTSPPSNETQPGSNHILYRILPTPVLLSF